MTCLQRGRAPAARCARKNSAKIRGIFAKIARVRVDFARFLRRALAPRPQKTCTSHSQHAARHVGRVFSADVRLLPVARAKTSPNDAKLSQKSRASALILRDFCVKHASMNAKRMHKSSLHGLKHVDMFAARTCACCALCALKLGRNRRNFRKNRARSR